MKLPRERAGRWRGLEVAIKTIVFSARDSSTEGSLVATEAAIASTLVHDNIVATYSHDVQLLSPDPTGHSGELPVFKFFLVQVCPPAARVHVRPRTPCIALACAV